MKIQSMLFITLFATTSTLANFQPSHLSAGQIAGIAGGSTAGAGVLSGGAYVVGKATSQAIADNPYSGLDGSISEVNWGDRTVGEQTIEGIGSKIKTILGIGDSALSDL